MARVVCRAMHRRNVVALALAFLVLSSTSPAAASDLRVYSSARDEGPSGVEVVADLLIVRPLGVVVTLVGVTFFAVGVPFAAITGDVGTVGRVLVAEPANYTFARPLGDLELEPTGE